MSYVLPPWAPTLRSHQAAAIEEVLHAYSQGAKYVLLDAPPGCGKTLVADIVRQELGVRKALHVCTTKGLQDQIMRDFPAHMVLKGRANYPSQTPPATAEDCNARDDHPCSFCPVPAMCAYKVAKVKAVSARCAVLNTSYLLAEANGSLRPAFSGYPFVVMDEADLLEDALGKYIEIPLTATLLDEIKVVPVGKHAHRDKWQEWVTDEVLPALLKRMKSLARKGDNASLWEQRRLRTLTRLTNKLAALNISTNWVRTGWLDRECIFKPVEINGLAVDALWRHAEKWLLMSGSFLALDVEAAKLGIPDGEWASVTVPSTFPAANRPVYPVCSHSMSRNERDASLPFIAARLNKIMKAHPTSRILVHVNSYQNARDLAHFLRSSSRVITYTQARERDQALRQYELKPGSVLIAPSMERGIDLPDEACDVCVIAKIPYPYLGDAQVAARMRLTNGRVWYTLETIKTIVQASQRGVRHVNDKCITYILDRDFLKLWEESGRYFPKWWKDAVVWDIAAIA